VLLVGSIASTHGAPGRWWFAAGAGAAEHQLVHRARIRRSRTGPVFQRRHAWRVLDGGIAVLMLTLAVSVLIGA
jgi:L-lysine exporter family protein LysE/ArgO